MLDDETYMVCGLHINTYSSLAKTCYKYHIANKTTTNLASMDLERGSFGITNFGDTSDEIFVSGGEIQFKN